MAKNYQYQMFVSTPRGTKALWFNSGEIENNSRERIGFHVYLPSYFFFDFNELTLPQQHKIAFIDNGVQLGGR